MPRLNNKTFYLILSNFFFFVMLGRILCDNYYLFYLKRSMIRTNNNNSICNKISTKKVFGVCIKTLNFVSRPNTFVIGSRTNPPSSFLSIQNWIDKSVELINAKDMEMVPVRCCCCWLVGFFSIFFPYVWLTRLCRPNSMKIGFIFSQWKGAKEN